MTDSPAAILRRAAEKARGLANAATEGPWAVGKSGMSVWVEAASRDLFVADTGDQGNEFAEADTAYIAAMHPGIALLIADQWDAVADEMDEYAGTEEREGAAGVAALVGTAFRPSKVWTAALASARGFLGEEAAQ